MSETDVKLMEHDVKLGEHVLLLVGDYEVRGELKKQLSEHKMIQFSLFSI